MPRIATALAATALLAALLLILLWRPELAPPAGGGDRPTNAAVPSRVANGDLASPPEPAAASADVDARRLATPDAPEADVYTVHGVVIAADNVPFDGARILAWRGEPTDVGGMLPTGVATMQSATPSFVLTGEPLAAADVAPDGTFELRATQPHLRVTIDHDLYLQPLPEVVHVPAQTHTASLVLTPLLGAMLRGRLLGGLAAEVDQVRVQLDFDPMAAVRDPRAMLSAMTNTVRPPTSPSPEGTFVFRAVPPATSLLLRATGGRATAEHREPALAPGEVRDVVIAVRPGAELHIVVVDEAEHPIADAAVQAIATGERGVMAQLGARRAVTDAAGSALLRQLMAGEYRVSGSAAGRTAANATVRVDVESPGRVQLVLGSGGSVTGRVLDPDGTPIPGAHVAHQPATDVPMFGELSSQLGPETLAQIANSGVESDANGAFRLTGLADPDPFLVVAAHPRHSVGIAREVRMGDEGVEVRLRRRSSIAARVVAGDPPRPVNDFRATLLRTSFLVMQTPSARIEVHDPDGRFELGGAAADSLSLQIEADGFATFERSITLPDEGRSDLGELVLVPAARVRGVVRAVDGTPIRGALVRLRKGALADNPMLTMFQGNTLRTFSDASGRFELGPLAPGHLQLLATADGYASGRSERLRITAGSLLTDVVLELGHGGTIAGRLVCGPGQQVSDFLLMVQNQTTQTTTGTDVRSDGTFVVTDLDPGTWIVQAMPRSLFSDLGGADWRPGEGIKLGDTIRRVTDATVSQRATVRDGETSEVELDVGDVQVGSRWHVHVTVGGRAQQGMVEARSSGDGSVRMALLEDGVATFGHVQPGMHRLQVRNGMSLTPVGAAVELEFPKGTDEHHSRLELPGGELRGRVIDAATGQPLRQAVVRLLHEGRAEQDDPIGMALTGDDGAFAFDGLADGTYGLLANERLRANGADTASRIDGIRVSTGASTPPVELRARPAAGAVVQVLDAAGRPVAGATLLCVDEQGRPLGALGIASSGADGRAWFGGMANGPARIVGRAPGLAPAFTRVQQLDAATASEFTLTLPDGALTRISVTGKDGEVLRNPTLQARYDGGPWLPPILLQRGIDPNGTIDLGPLAPGTWEFRAQHPSVGELQSSRSIRSSGPVTIVLAPR